MNMKRRNAECVKLRRTISKRGKIDSLYGSTFIYVKFLMVWIMVLFADFILEFRFEYLWPFWLLLRSVYDSYKYQGLAFSVFFVCIALTSDMICFLFIPVHWLFFIASTYVWVQYVWHTDKGVCLPTISLWLLFLYIEASVRLKELKNLPFHMDLCRPFAAHCIGYPMVTLGFGFKSYVGFKVRQRKQKDVQKENEFYMQLLQQALPAEIIQQNVEAQLQQQSPTSVVPISDKNLNSKVEEPVLNGNVPNGTPPLNGAKNNNNNTITKKQNPDKETKFSESETRTIDRASRYQNGSIQSGELEYMEKRKGSTNDSEEILEKDKTLKCSNPSPPKSSNKWNPNPVCYKDNVCNSQKEKKSKANKENVFVFTGKDEQILRLEADIKRLKNDLQSSRLIESELRSQINSLLVEEKSVKNELLLIKQDNDNLQSKLNSLLTSKQQDKQMIINLERKIQEEKKSKSIFESQLASERKAKRAEEAANQRAAALAAARIECPDTCKLRKRELENDLKICRKELRQNEERKRLLEREVQTLLQYKESQKDTEIFVSAISALQDKNSLLEESLSAENKVKLDLFSALGEAKRQLQISQGLIVAKDKEIEELKSKVTEVLAVMPSHPSPTPSIYNTVAARSSDIIYTSKLLSAATDSKPVVAVSGSTLDPNASVYTPKNVLLTSDN